MKIVRSTQRVTESALSNHPKELLYSNIHAGIGAEIYRSRLCKSSTIEHEDRFREPFTLTLETYVMHPDEFKKCINILHMIRQALPTEERYLANDLYKIFTDQNI